MSHFELPGTPPVTVQLRRSARARRLSLRVSRLDGRVTLTMPHAVDEAEARAFAQVKSGWIRDHLAARPSEEQVDIGTVLPVAGVSHAIVAGQGRRAVLSDGQITVAPQSAGRRVKALLVDLARARLDVASRRYADQIDRPIAEIALRDTRSRWGSCTERGRLMFSWRLMMAPPEILDYVAAHEVAHLKEMNHGPAFWALVEDLYGPCRTERRWLHEHAGALHRFRF